MRQTLLRAALAALLLNVLAACAPTPTPAPTPVPTATITPGPSPTPSPTPIAPPAGWKLVWHDEFEGSQIDPKNWTYDLGGGGWGNGEMEIYTDRPENARLENGMLVISSLAEVNSKGGISFTSARLKSQGLQAFQYGRIEARTKVPSGSGFWPAFWMLGENFPTAGWPNCGEIDIMEYMGKEPNLIFGTMHGPGYSGGRGLTKQNPQAYPIADDFHTYAIEWDTNQISWFYDDVKYSTYTRADLGSSKWVFDQPFFILLNMAIGGSLGGRVPPETVYPVQYLIDYVRVFQR